MATHPASVAGEYGISSTLEGYTIESENITDSPRREEVPDQRNAVAKEIRYDTRYDLRLTVRGATKPSTATIKYDNKDYIVDSVEKAGTYNGLQRWNITAHRYDNCSAETAVTTTPAQTSVS